MKNTVFHYPLAYKGNVLFLIIFAIFWPPLGVVLAIKNGQIKTDKKAYSLYYKGDMFWLIVWAIIFFPIAIILGLINGMDVVEEDLPMDQVTKM